VRYDASGRRLLPDPRASLCHSKETTMATRTTTLRITETYPKALTDAEKSAIDAAHSKWFGSIKAAAENASTAIHNHGNPATPATATTIELVGVEHR
jgi:hypothetical protein